MIQPHRHSSSVVQIMFYCYSAHYSPSVRKRRDIAPPLRQPQCTGDDATDDTVAAAYNDATGNRKQTVHI